MVERNLFVVSRTQCIIILRAPWNFYVRNNFTFSYSALTQCELHEILGLLLKDSTAALSNSLYFPKMKSAENIEELSMALGTLVCSS